MGKDQESNCGSDALLLSDEKEAPQDGSASASLKFYSITLTNKNLTKRKIEIMKKIIHSQNRI